jgi:hypothetical protein
MAKAQVPKTQISKKNKEDEEEDVLVGRVKKVVKKSRRKLSEEKFERQLKRTIAFLEELRSKLNDSQNSVVIEKKKATAERKTKPESSRKRGKTSSHPVKPAVKAAAKSAK